MDRANKIIIVINVRNVMEIMFAINTKRYNTYSYVKVNII